MVSRYIRERSKLILYYLFVVVVYLVCAVLFHEHIMSTVYPLVVVSITGSVLLINDYFRVKARYRLLDSLHDIKDVMVQGIPEDDNLVCGEYRRIIYQLLSDINDTEVLEKKNMDEIINYFTIWVHQIKTPIAAMKLTLQREDSEMARRLNLEMTRIEQYVQMVLGYLRLEADSTDYVIKECDLDKIIRASVKTFRGEFISRKLKLYYEGVDYRVLTDEKWLCFAVEQVISNALKYTKEGSISIYMSGETELCIEDTGIGIEAADLPRVFERGYTGITGRLDKRASGIGLSLVKEIMARLGHGIRIESEVNSGTRVYLDFAKYSLQVE